MAEAVGFNDVIFPAACPGGLLPLGSACERSTLSGLKQGVPGALLFIQLGNVGAGRAFLELKPWAVSSQNESVWLFQVIRLLKARIKASITCQGICMKSIAAAHLSFLITFHQDDSLSQTVTVISWGRGAALTRGKRTVGPLFCSLIKKRNTLSHPVWAGRGVRPIRPAARATLTPDARVPAGQRHDKLSPKSLLTASDD